MLNDDKPPTRKLPDGHVMARVLPKGHGRVHTGNGTVARIVPDEARGQLTGDARLRADADALIAASVRSGQTYAKGERVALPLEMAMQLEDRGLVEIVEDA
jgi:hypothetical protein